MSLFDLLNAPSEVKPTYLKNSELPLFVPLKIMKLEKAVTVIGPTTKIEALMGAVKVFFYLGDEDHQRIQENEGMMESLMALVNAQENPFCFSIKTNKKLAIRYIPFDPEIVTQCRNKSKLRLSQLPTSVRSEINIDTLRESGIVLEA